MIEGLNKVFERFRIVPKDISLYETAFTHASYSNEHRECASYDRLEFLGDSILDMVVGDLVFQAYPSFNSGYLSKTRSVLVSGKSLTELSSHFGFSSLVRYSVGEKGNTRNHKKIDEDIFEAFIGAVYLDQGYLCVRSLIEEIMKPKLEEASKIAFKGDSKSRLQEVVAPQNLTYVIVKSENLNSEDVCYTVEVRVGDTPLGVGKGHNHKAAEVEAASDALSKMVGE